jgi:hypothetical protein
MKFAFYISTGKSREAPLRDAWVAGCKVTGDELVVLPNSVAEPVPADVAVMVGLKSIDFRFKCQALGQRVLTFDKGYDRKEDWWRVSIDTHQPTPYLMTLKRPDDRMRAAGWSLMPWRVSNPDSPVIIAGGGRKYYDAHDLAEPVAYIGSIVEAIRAAGCRRKIWYRPKPSMADVIPVRDTVLSRHKSIYQILGGHAAGSGDGAHALITYGSNACFEAMLAGVPSIVIGDAVMRPVSSTSLAEIERPRFASEDDRLSLLSTLAYCQFRLHEIAIGAGINELKTQLREVISNISRREP